MSGAGDVLRLPANILGLTILWLLFLCGPALAHTGILEASPDYGEKVTGSPEQVRLRFNEPVEAVFEPIKVLDRQGDRVDSDDARVDPEDPQVVAIGLRDDLPTGQYTVEWRVTSGDGHPVHGSYDFVKAPSAEAGEAEEVATRSVGQRRAEPSGGSGAGVMPGLALAGVVAVIGVVALRRVRG